MPRWALAAMAAMGLLFMLGAMLGSAEAIVPAMVVILSDGILALLLLFSAGGYGYWLYRLLKLAAHAAGAADVGQVSVPAALVAATAGAAGLWVLSTAMLIAGSLIPGALSPWVWWPVVAVGAVLALLPLHKALGRVQLPKRATGASLVWVVCALAAGVWLAGAVMPPGWLGSLTLDSYDIQEYHLQLPREYYHAGHVSTLRHNVYSHYPLGVEMLMLLGMCLRGGPYGGAYLAQFISGLFMVLIVIGTFSLRRMPPWAAAGGKAAQPADRQQADWLEDFRTRAAIVLLSTAPWLLYLSWLAMQELAQIAYLCLALLWLRHWLARPSWLAAVWIGVMLGGACSVKYLSVGLVAAPVLAVMLAAALRDVRRLKHVALAVALALAVFSPWLIRNVMATGNPIFPLGTRIFGQGHWSDESARRWQVGHAAGFHEPVPAPPEYHRPQQGWSTRQRFSSFLLGYPPLGDPPLGAAVVAIFAGSVLSILLRPMLTWWRARRASSHGAAAADTGAAPAVDRWEWALLAVLAMQLAVWAIFTRDMPARFVAVAVPPISFLAVGGLARLAAVRQVRWLRQAPAGDGRWGTAPALMLLVAAAALNLMAARAYFKAQPYNRQFEAQNYPLPAGLNPEVFTHQAEPFRAASQLRGPGRLMLVGESRLFYFPHGSVYATVFDSQLLAEMLGRTQQPAELARRLGELGVTHVLVNWLEIQRLSRTYGWPAALRPERLKDLMKDWPVVDELRMPTSPTTQPATAASAPATAPGQPAAAGTTLASTQGLLVYTIYAVPARSGVSTKNVE